MSMQFLIPNLLFSQMDSYNFAKKTNKQQQQQQQENKPTKQQQ